VVQTEENNLKVAVFDLDGTITYKDTYVDFLLFCLRKQPLRILRAPALACYVVVYKAGLRTNHWLKVRFLRTVAGGLGGQRLEDLCSEFSQNTIKNNFKPQALAELQRLRESGYALVLATASFDFYVSRLFDALSMDYLVCTVAKRDRAGRITGEIDGKNCIGKEKAERLRILCNEQYWSSIDRAYSDDIVDRPLFELASVALVVDPKPKTEKLASGLGYQLLSWS